jgi:hypothetical protein
MRPPESITPPVFQAVDPIILDNEMEGLYQDNDIDFLTSHEFSIPGSDAGHDFDEIFSRNPSSNGMSNVRIDSSPTVSMKKNRPLQNHSTLQSQSLLAVGSPTASPENSSSPRSSSESVSVRDHGRQYSITSTNSAVHSEDAVLTGQFQNGWLHSGQDETLFGLDSDLQSLSRNFSFDADIESSNKVMDSAFDFESAASSPSALKLEINNTQIQPPRTLNSIRSPPNGKPYLSRSKVPGSVSLLSSRSVFLRIPGSSYKLTIFRPPLLAPRFMPKAPGNLPPWPSCSLPTNPPSLSGIRTLRLQVWGKSLVTSQWSADPRSIPRCLQVSISGIIR